MKLPQQTNATSNRTTTTKAGQSARGITPSWGCCPGDQSCKGLCFFGQCLGVCG